MSLLDVLVGKGYVGLREEGAVLGRGEKRATWGKVWGVHVDFSGVIPEVRLVA
jgi:hypothetical protein